MRIRGAQLPVTMAQQISARRLSSYCPGALCRERPATKRVSASWSDSAMGPKVSALRALTFSRFGVRSFRRRNANSFAARAILGFSRHMSGAIRTGIEFYKRMVEKENQVVVIGGVQKEAAIHATLKAKAFNHWFTDEIAARTILEMT